MRSPESLSLPWLNRQPRMYGTRSQVTKQKWTPDTICSNLSSRRNVRAIPSRDTISVYASCFGTERIPIPLVQHPDIRRQIRTPAWPGIRSDQGQSGVNAEPKWATPRIRTVRRCLGLQRPRGAVQPSISRNATRCRYRSSEAHYIEQPTTAEAWKDNCPAAVQPTTAEMSSRYI